MDLHRLLNESVVSTSLRSSNRDELFAEMVGMLVRAGRIADRDAGLAALHSRERLGSTGIGGGIAVPHGRSRAVPRLTAALGVSPRGIDYETPDNEPVRIVFLMLADMGNPVPHVECLAEIARLRQVPGFCGRLRGARTPAEALAVIKAEE
ncbi:MAG: PTS sugar transporter subunit IIA [Planctomycetes bacterium]|nr:PTS sugar transporter subunit IIA [Planctomycetota bacterium]